MPKFKIYATSTTEYELTVEAEDAEQAYKSMNDMISDDFEGYQTDGKWDFKIVEEETE